MAAVKTSSEQEQLPLHALLAFVARCARRVQPLFKYDAANTDAAACAAAIDAAIHITEQLASGASIDPVELCTAEENAVRAVLFASETYPDDERAAYAANAAYAALNASKGLLEGVANGNPAAEAARVADAA